MDSTGKAAAGLKSFLSGSLDGGGGEWVGDWKKEDGQITFWIHPECDLASATYFTHSFFRTKTYDARADEPEATKVRWYKFVCCDPDRTAGGSRWYEKDGYRQNPPVVCPIDFLMEWVSVEIVAGRLDWKTPIFEFRGDDPKGDRIIHAGGMLGLFDEKHRDMTKEKLQDLRKGRIDVSSAFQEDLRARGGYLLAVIDDDKREFAQKYAIQGTGNPLKSLPGMFKEAIKMVMKGYRVDDPTTGQRVDIPPANPLERPFRFSYLQPPPDPKTGKPKGFGEYRVAPLNRQPDKKIREIMALPCPDLTDDRAKGNCPELRMIMEQHCVYKPLPIDSFFERADKAGLMKPRDERPKKPPPGRTHEVSQREGVDRRVVDRPGDREARAAATVAAATVECLRCGRGMPADDLICGTCNATYNAAGDLDGIQCLRCSTVVPVNDADGKHICPKCAAVHTLDYEEDPTRAAGRSPVWKLGEGDILPGDAEEEAPISDEIPF